MTQKFDDEYDDDDLSQSRVVFVALIICGVTFFSILLGLILAALHAAGMV